MMLAQLFETTKNFLGGEHMRQEMEEYGHKEEC